MRIQNKPFLFFSAWLVLSVLQAAFTKLTSDEGYYWFYTFHLQWGYYDHPPLIALMIKTGYSLFQNELGVRLLNVLITSCSFLLLFRLIPENLRQKNFTYPVLLAQPLLHYFSIIVFPDGPLLFFSLLFLLGYKRLLEKNDAASALMMGLSLAGMFYSKYHGVLLLAFTLLSNLRLLKSKWFWISLVIPLILAIPHVWWQYKNGFPSLQYHLQDRATGFTWRFAGEYISQQLPAIGPAFLIAAFGFRSENQFEKTLKFISLGALFFFLLISFRSFVHFHWTSLTLFPLALMAIKYYEDKRRRKLFYWLAAPFLLAIILFRIHIVWPFLPFKQRDLGYYHNRDLWAKDVSKLAAGHPVLFVQSFREAGLYSFYTGQTSVALFSNPTRRTQYDLWGYEDSLQGKQVLLVQKNSFPECNQLQSRLGKMIYYQAVPKFESCYNIPMNIKLSMSGDDTLHISMEIFNNRKSDLFFYADSSRWHPILFYRIRKDNKAVMNDTLKIFSEKDKLPAGNSRKLNFKIPVKELADGTYSFESGFYYGILPPSFNSMKNYFTVKRKG